MRLSEPLPPVARTATRWEWATICGMWLAFALLATGPWIALHRKQGVEMVGWHVMAGFVLDSLIWIALAPLLFRILDRIPLARGVWLRNLALAALLGVAAAAVHAMIALPLVLTIARLVGAQATAAQSPLLGFLAFAEGDFWNYWLTVVSHAILQRVHRNRSRQQRAAQLETSLVQAKLHALNVELQPHFLFNTLNDIAALVHAAPDDAERMLVTLSDLLRVTLERGADGEVRLADELAHLDMYLDIQRMRFGERLRVREAIDAGVLAACVPSMLLQPLVENALTHGIAPKLGPGELAITATGSGGRLRITVEDDGMGLAPGGVKDGLGLGNTRSRLAALFPNAHSLTLASRPGGGAIVHLEIPMKVSAVSRHAARAPSAAVVADGAPSRRGL